ncbi:hypothetical protein [Candidatus Methanoperedens nitratireducens]|uniref:SpoVT-AbrB domain-containing protein n=1 Tax=Candidatus Methanoperedens nitratireducens TaxID=1392998 RepID=A0A284VU61_9EURY|nr:hypothetical protein [Candidatus Methanoperedens nitroreducens]SNQ62749.1 conserved hypothetical protein [Candidatus Methanoperedens nitroreducens]
MEKKSVVKARLHHGAKSLDLTIPVSICEDFNISEGDVFSVEVNKQDNDFKLIYRRILKQ